MKVKRVTEVETDCPRIGDQIIVDHYTATCQKISQKGVLFLLDQYLDEPMAMNAMDTNLGGYGKSDLRKALQSDEVLSIFAGIRDDMVPFDDGDLLRIPFAGEMFCTGLSNWAEPDGHERWPLMQDRRNRLALRCGDYEWGWLQNKDKASPTDFCVVGDVGFASNWSASGVLGVRLVFLIARESILD